MDNLIKTSSLEDLEPDLHKGEFSKIQANALLSKSIECLSQSNQIGQLAAQIPKSTKLNGDRRITESKDLEASEKPEIEDTVDLLCEQLETLNQLLEWKQLELDQIKQELNYTNKELCAALNREWLTLDEAKELVKKILVSKKPHSQSLAKLLSTIYSSTVKASELEQIDTSNSITPLTSHVDNCLLNGCEKFRSMMPVLRKQAAETRAKSRMLRKQACEVKAELKELKAQFNALGTEFVSFPAYFMTRQANSILTQAQSNSSDDGL